MKSTNQNVFGRSTIGLKGRMNEADILVLGSVPSTSKDMCPWNNNMFVDQLSTACLKCT